ncbi:MAG: hypothetical protein ABS36_03755 [Acidobacteria bacterium SCN 69-37]|nr:MAG: hypothetical protein ABS36_03755 [Acidobacteria bacterium SCN 69-37]
MIQHIVLFTPKADLPAATRQAFAGHVTDTLAASPAISRYTVGRRVDIDAGYQRSAGDKVYEYAAVLEFDDRDRLIAYLNDPTHARLGNAFWEYCESCVVCEVDLSAPLV